ncbi:MAG: hypothetical protein ACFCVE_02370 [Phycisphaerae bacterium]
MTQAVDTPRALQYESKPQSALYQRLRLWCGITGIGLVLVPLWAGLALGLPGVLDDFFGGLHPVSGGFVSAALLGVFVTLVQLPVDVYAHRVEERFGRWTGAPWWPGYLKASAEWLGGVATAGLVVGVVVWLLGPAWPLPLAVGLLLLGFFHIAMPLSPAKRSKLPEEHVGWWRQVQAELESMRLPTPKVVWFDSGENALAGGWNGVGRFKTLFIAKSLTQVSPRVAAGLIAREIGHDRGMHRLTSAIATMLWVGSGLLIAHDLMTPELAVVSGWTFPTTPGLEVDVTARPPLPQAVFTIAAVMSTWCWLGLFVWPALGRRQVLAADAFAAERLGASDTQAMFDALARHNLPDEHLPPVKAFIFHPIPPLDVRRRVGQSPVFAQEM